MSHEIVVEFRGDHIYARHTGEDSYEISLDLWRRVMSACEEHRCYDILGESDNSNSLSVADAFWHIDIYRKVGITPRHHIAWVNHNPRDSKIFDLIETVLKNRFVVNGHMFETVAQARKWLADKADPPAR